MEILILNDGTQVNGHIMEDGDGRNIFVYLDGKTVVEGILLFSDAEKTSRITAQFHGSEHIYEGFTEIWSASHEFGNCNLTLRRASNDT